jgi:hypothetical protein
LDEQGKILSDGVLTKHFDINLRRVLSRKKKSHATIFPFVRKVGQGLNPT